MQNDLEEKARDLVWTRGAEQALIEFVEAGAALEHARWGRWQQHLHEKGVTNPDGSITIRGEDVTRWNRQIQTPYERLPWPEQESDRQEVREYLPLVRKLCAHLLRETDNGK